MKSKKFLAIRCKEKSVIWKFLKALANRFRLISKSIRHVKEQRSCLWPSFYQMNFMKKYFYVNKSRLDAQFVTKIPLATVISQQKNKERHDQNYWCFLHFTSHLFLTQIVSVNFVFWSWVLNAHQISMEELSSVMLWCNVYHYCRASLNKAWTLVLRIADG